MKLIPSLPASESSYSIEAHDPYGCITQNTCLRARSRSETATGRIPGKTWIPRSSKHGGKERALGRRTGKQDVGFPCQAHSLFQELFFFCTIKKVGDVPGAGCIYVETVVDRDSGVAFAKVYSAKNAINAVDILASRVVPFFERRGSCNQGNSHSKNERILRTACPCTPLKLSSPRLTSNTCRWTSPAQPHNYLCEQVLPVPFEGVFSGGPPKNISTVPGRTAERPGYFCRSLQCACK